MTTRPPTSSVRGSMAMFTQVGTATSPRLAQFPTSRSASTPKKRSSRLAASPRWLLRSSRTTWIGISLRSENTASSPKRRARRIKNATPTKCADRGPSARSADDDSLSFCRWIKLLNTHQFTDIWKRLTCLCLGFWLRTARVAALVGRKKPFGPRPQENYMLPWVSMLVALPDQEFMIFRLCQPQGQHSTIGRVGLLLRQTTASYMIAPLQQTMVLQASPRQRLTILTLPSLVPRKMRAGSMADAMSEQIMVLFWMMRSRNIVQTVLPARTICHTWRLSSNPHETALDPSQLMTISLTATLLAVRVKDNWPCWSRSQTWMLRSQLPEIKLWPSRRSAREVTAALWEKRCSCWVQVWVSQSAIELQPRSLPEASQVLPFLFITASLQMLALWACRTATLCPDDTSQTLIKPSFEPTAI